MNRDLTRGPVTRSMLLFAIPMILGDLLQQCYNIADTLIVGQFLGRDALAAVGSAFTLREAARLASYVSAYAATGYGAQASYGTSVQIRDMFALKR